MMRRRTITRRSGWLLVGVLAVMMAAPAFACQGDGGTLYVTPGGEPSSDVPPDPSILIRGEKFQPPPDGSDVAIRWGGKSGPIIAVRTPTSVGTFEALVKLPATARGFEQVTAIQTKLVNGVSTESTTEKSFDVTPMLKASTPAPTMAPPPGPNPVPTPGPMPPGPTPATAVAPIGAANPGEAPSRDAAGSGRFAPAGQNSSSAGNLPVLVGPVADDPVTAPAGSVVPLPVLPDAKSLWSGLDPAPGTGLLETTPSESYQRGPGGLLLLGGGLLLFAATAMAGLRRRSALRVLARA